MEKRRGQSTSEHGLILALVSLVVIGALTGLGAYAMVRVAKTRPVAGAFAFARTKEMRAML